MVAAKQQDDDAELRWYARAYIAEVKGRYNADQYKQFRGLIRRRRNLPNKAALLTEVEAIFGSDKYLIQGFKCFLPRQTPHSTTVRKTVDFVNKARRIIKDPNVVLSLLETIGDYKNHLNVDRAREQAFGLLEKYPDLKIELSALLPEGKHQRHLPDEAITANLADMEIVPPQENLPVKEIEPHKAETINFMMKLQDKLKNTKKLKQFVKIICDFENHHSANRVKEQVFDLLKNYPELKIEACGFLVEGIERNPGTKRSKKLTEMLCECEDDMHLKDLQFYRMLHAKDAAKKLIKENQNADPTEEIDISNYFSILDLACVKKELRGSGCLPNRSMSREQAVDDSIETVSRLEKKIQKLVSHSDNKFWEWKSALPGDAEVESDVQGDSRDAVEVFDWCTQLSEDKYPFSLD